jgi:hypothetical protein
MPNSPASLFLSVFAMYSNLVHPSLSIGDLKLFSVFSNPDKSSSSSPSLYNAIVNH